MAQRLKEEVKERIVNAALDLMLEQGFNSTDMRSIAKRAGITHGNMYRYFKGKDDLIAYITQPLISSMNDILARQTSGAINIFDSDTHGFLTHKNPEGAEELLNLLNVLSFKCVQAFYTEGQKNKKTMQVILQNNIIEENILNWLKAIADSCFSEIFKLTNSSKENTFATEVILESLAGGFCKGISLILKNCIDVQKEEFEYVLKNYIDIQTQCIKFAAIKQIELGNISLNSEGLTLENNKTKI